MRAPHRAFSLGNIVIAETVRTAFEQTQLYSYTRTRRPSPTVLHWLMRWLSEAQRDDGGFAAYYSLLAGYSKSYPEVTGYIIPTLYDFARGASDKGARISAGRAVNWLLTLQMPDGSFPGGLHGADGQPSVFNTGQILQGLVRENIETGRSGILASARAAGDWLIANQQADGSWSGPGAYQERAHSYYSMVAWALAELSAQTNTEQYAIAAEKNLDWVLSHFRPKGWVDGINLQGHPTYLHFIAYVLQ